MKVFISWSGERSKHIAASLKMWLKDVIQTLDPWMSDLDIKIGSRGISEIAKQLQDASVGIICLTPENLNEPWVLFEAGAISKAVDKSYVCTFLYDIEEANITGPLAQFQWAKAADKTKVRQMLDTLNDAQNEGKLDKERLDRIFERFWPELNEKLNAIPKIADKPATPRLLEDKVNEILQLVRSIDNYTSDWRSPNSLAEAVEGFWGKARTNAMYNAMHIGSPLLGNSASNAMLRQPKSTSEPIDTVTFKSNNPLDKKLKKSHE